MTAVVWQSKALAGLLVGLALLAGSGDVASAQTDPTASYPSRTVRIVVGFAAGGGNDIIARIVAQKLQEDFGQPFIIENKVGGGGSVAALSVKAAAPDGYTLLVGASGAMSVIPAISVKPPYATLKDFAPISNLAAFPLILVVHPSTSAHAVQELVAFMKANPDRSNYATSSFAFTLPTELFKLRAGAPATAIPYKSSNESLLSVISKQSLFAIADPPPTTPQVKGGELRALAVTSQQRLADLPDVPTMLEAGVPGIDLGLWSGVFAPAATPPAIAKKLEAKLREAILSPDVSQKLRAMAANPGGTSSQEFRQMIDADIKVYEGVVKAANLTFED